MRLYHVQCVHDHFQRHERGAGALLNRRFGGLKLFVELTLSVLEPQRPEVRSIWVFSFTGTVINRFTGFKRGSALIAPALLLFY